MKFFKHLVCTVFFAVTFSVFSQNPEAQKQTINDGSINDKFEFVLKKSGNFRGTNGLPYEAVKRSMFLDLQKHTRDTINALKTTLTETRSTVDSQQKEITDLKANLTKTQDTLNATNKEKDSMSLFGIQLSKTGYNLLMWTIIGVLFALLLLFIFRFKNSNTVTKAAKSSLADLENEFEEHRRVALEREQKVRRQLQDEINKQKGI